MRIVFNFICQLLIHIENWKICGHMDAWGYIMCFNMFKSCEVRGDDVHTSLWRWWQLWQWCPIVYVHQERKDKERTVKITDIIYVWWYSSDPMIVRKRLIHFTTSLYHVYLLSSCMGLCVFKCIIWHVYK